MYPGIAGNQGRSIWWCRWYVCSVSYVWSVYAYVWCVVCPCVGLPYRQTALYGDWGHFGPLQESVIRDEVTSTARNLTIVCYFCMFGSITIIVFIFLPGSELSDEEAKSYLWRLKLQWLRSTCTSPNSNVSSKVSSPSNLYCVLTYVRGLLAFQVACVCVLVCVCTYMCMSCEGEWCMYTILPHKRRKLLC